MRVGPLPVLIVVESRDRGPRIFGTRGTAAIHPRRLLLAPRISLRLNETTEIKVSKSVGK